MRHQFVRQGILSSLLFCATGSAFAFTANVSQENKSLSTTTQALLKKYAEHVVRPEVAPSTSKTFRNVDGEIQVDTLTGAPHIITGQLTVGLKSLNKEDLVGMSLDWIAAHQDAMQIDVNDLKVIDNATLVTDDVQFIRFAVSRGGVPVKDASVMMRFKKGVLVQVVNDSYAQAINSNPGCHAIVGVESNLEKIAGIEGVQAGEFVYRVEQTSNGYKLTYVQQSTATLDGEPVAIETNAETGALFEVKPTHHYAQGRAHGGIFQRTYYKSQPIDGNFQELNMKDGSTSVRSTVDGAFDSAGALSIAGLSGARVTVKTSTGTALAKKANMVDGKWDLNIDTTAEKDQAQSNVYYHTNQVIQRALQYIKSPWLEKPITANVNLSQTCNAYWDGSTLNFFSAGGGCGNTGLISDVPQHEWGHGLDDNTGGIDDGAFSEGYGDTMSIVMNRDFKVGPGFKSADGGAVRDLSQLKVYPKDKGEVHAEGMIIGGTFWDLYQGLAAKYLNNDKANDILAAIAFKVIFTATKYTDVYAAALVINDDDANVNNGTPDFCVINAAFTKHGLATKATNCP